MLSPLNVTACLVTKGDQPEAMQRVLDSLIFPHVIVWDNSVRDDWKVAGRYMAATEADTDLVYFQDDDVIVPKAVQGKLLEEYDGEPCLANWAHGETPDGYHDLPLPGGGAIANKQACLDAIALYAKHHPLDDAYRYEADFVVGALYPSFRHLHEPFYIDMAIAQGPERLCNQPWQKDLKYVITKRARALRGKVLVPS
jgi:hypothetical protein